MGDKNSLSFDKSIRGIRTIFKKKHWIADFKSKNSMMCELYPKDLLKKNNTSIWISFSFCYLFRLNETIFIVYLKQGKQFEKRISAFTMHLFLFTKVHKKRQCVIIVLRLIFDIWITVLSHRMGFLWYHSESHDTSLLNQEPEAAKYLWQSYWERVFLCTRNLTLS